MKRLLTSLLCTSLLLPVAAPKPAPRWNLNAQNALAGAKRSGKPVLLNFGATWCSPCHELDKTVFKNAPFARESRNWVLAKIDAENGAKNIALAQKHRVAGYPTLILLGSTGRELGRIEGFLPKQIVPLMKAARRESKPRR